MALSGWGQVDSAALNFAASRQTDTEVDAKDFGSAWLAYFAKTSPELAREAWSVGVRDDASYHSLERSLDWGMRQVLGTARMEYLLKTRDPEDPIQVATCCPPWLIDMPLDMVNATVRCINSLRTKHIVFVSDLLHLTVNDLLKIPNFGRKSLSDLSRTLRANATKGPPVDNSFSARKQFESDVGILSLINRRSAPLEDSYKEIPPYWISFKLAFQSIKSRLKDNQVIVLDGRSGLGGEKKTLAEIADEMEITRERVRQIESAVIGIFQADQVWQKELMPRLDNLLHDREDPLPVQSLRIFDQWFADVENMMAEFIFVIDRVLEGNFFVLQINGCHFITNISADEWRHAVREGSLLLEQAAQEKATKSDTRLRVEGLLGGKGSELAVELWASVQPFALYARDQYDIEQIVGVGTSAESLVSAILVASDRPLHYKELPKHIQETFGRSVDTRRAHSAAINVGLLWGRGTYGSFRHCPLTQGEMDVLCQEAEEIILSGPNGRQWSCFELVERLDDCALEFGDRVNQYVVEVSLQHSSVLSSLGRFVWVQSGENSTGIQDRIDICEATISVLQSAGRPMSRSEIRAALIRDRGLSGYFQINPKGSLVRVGEGLWGILERDIQLSIGAIRDIRLSTAKILEETQRGIHLTEIQERLRDAVPEALRVENPYMIFSVLLTDVRFKASGSGYIYLASWQEPRRLSQLDAVGIALQEAKSEGIRISDIARRVATLLGRPVERENIYSAIVANGATFDEDTGRWIMLAEDDSEATVDEGVDS